MSSSFIWLLLVVAFLILEAISAGLISVWFAIGGLAAFVTSIFTNSITAQIVVFFTVSIVILLATLPLAKKYRAKKASPTNAQRNIGQMGQVVVAISPQVPGRVKVDGVDWIAKSTTSLEVGELCIVQKIESATVFVKPVKNEETAKAQ